MYFCKGTPNIFTRFWFTGVRRPAFWFIIVFSRNPQPHLLSRGLTRFVHLFAPEQNCKIVSAALENNFLVRSRIGAIKWKHKVSPLLELLSQLKAHGFRTSKFFYSQTATATWTISKIYMIQPTSTSQILSPPSWGQDKDFWKVFMN